MSREASSLNLGEFRVTMGGCGFDPVRWPFQGIKSCSGPFRLKFAMHEGFYIKGSHLSSSKSSNKPFNPSSKDTHYFHNLPRKCVPSPQSSPSSRAASSHPSKRRLKLAGNARPIKDCSNSNNRLEPTHSTANS